MRVSSSVGRGDHDPELLEARAIRLDESARVLSTWTARDVDVRRVVRELRDTAGLLRRFANDLRVLDGFLRGAGLLAERDDDQGDQVAS